MKESKTTRGKTYAVTSANGCTVTTEDGLTLATVEAGSQGYFVATGSNVTLSDDAAALTEVFKLAPYQKLRLLGVVGGNVPAWLASLKDGLTAMLDGSKFVLDWIASEKKLVVHTDRVDDAVLTEVADMLAALVPVEVDIVQYNHNMEISWKDINKYAACKTIQQMYDVDPDKFEVQDLGWTKRYIINDLTSDGDFVYPLTSLVRTENGVNSSFSKVRVPHFSLTLPSATNVQWCFYAFSSSASSASSQPREITLNAPLATDAHWACARNVNLKKINCYLPQVTNFNCFAEECAIEEVEGDFSSASSGISMFNYGRLNKKSALNVLTSIPSHASGEHPLTIGIHIDHKFDVDVNLALKKADINYTPTVELPEEVTEGKGWTLTVQWEGTSTSGASTYGRGQLIYAKLDDVKLPDGTEERVLDWGHYVTNWEERGYEQFRSLESAYRYFGLEMPAEPETND